MDSKRLATLKALTSHLRGDVTLDNGYEFDLQNGVYRGRDLFDADDALPCVSILDNVNSDRFPVRAGNNDGGVGYDKSRWTILINGWVDDDHENPTDPAEQLMATVKQSLAKIISEPHPMAAGTRHANYMLGGLIAGMEIEPGTVRPPDQISAKAYFWMRVILSFVEDVSNPFDHG